MEPGDNTEWAVQGFYHLYYCPFCGTFIKGRGWGRYDEKFVPDRSRESNSAEPRTYAKPGREPE